MPQQPALAKLTPPRLERICPRPRLFRRLAESRPRGVVWVQGPPGSGKTALVASWLERCRRPALWYRLDRSDAEVATFFHHLGLAARRGRRRPELPRFRPELALDVPAFASHFFRALFGGLAPGFALVLDDYHDVPAGSELHGVVRAGLAELPRGACAVVMSRSGVPASLARLQAYGALARIGAEELKLTPAESRAVVRLRGGRRLLGAAGALHAQADGWAAGLTVLLTAEDRGAGDRAAARRRHELFPFFAGEVLERSDPVTQRVLLETSLLPQVSATAARQVTGVARCDAILADLAARGYFTARHPEAAAYTYHPLFREFLLERAGELLPPARLSEVRRRAARIAAGSGAVSEALALLRDAGAHDDMARLVLERAPQLLEQGRAETLRRLIRDLPAGACDRDPWLSYWLGLSWLGFDLEEARRALERAHALFVEGGEAAGAYLSCAAALDSYAFEWCDFRPLDRWIDAFRALRRRWPRFPGAEVEARAACGIFTALASRRPEDPELASWEARVEGIAAAANDAALRARAGFALVHFAVWRGDLPRARALLETVRPLARADPSTDVGWLVHAARAAVTAGAGEEALDLVEKGLGLARDSGNHWWDFGLWLVGVWGASQVGDAARVRAYLDRMHQAFDPTMRSYYEQARGLALLRSGEARAAGEHLERSLAAAVEVGALFPASWGHAALAALAQARGDDPAAARHLEEAERLAGATRSRVVRYWTLLLRALAALRTDRAQAIALAGEALRLSREAGPFDEMWLSPGDLARLCALAMEAGVEVEEARAVAARRRLDPPAGSEGIDGWPWPVAVRTLGPFRLSLGGVPVATSGRQQTRPLQVLKALVAMGGREVAEWKLAEALWPDGEADAAQHALESNLHRLRKLLRTREAVVQRERRLSLNGRVCWVDALALEEHLSRSRRPASAADARAEAERVLSLYLGPFLEAEEGLWASPMRDRLRRRIRPLVEALASGSGRADGEQQAARELARRDEALAAAARPGGA